MQAANPKVAGLGSLLYVECSSTLTHPNPLQTIGQLFVSPHFEIDVCVSL